MVLEEDVAGKDELLWLELTVLAAAGWWSSAERRNSCRGRRRTWLSRRRSSRGRRRTRKGDELPLENLLWSAADGEASNPWCGGGEDG